MKLTPGKVNELSGNIDLESTLMKAEALFIKFQRVVEAVDKQENFPAPRRFGVGWSSPSRTSIKQTPDSPSSGGSGTSDNDSSKDKGKAAETPAQAKVITPELRKLLNKNYLVLPRSTVSQQGDGMPTR